MSETVPNSPQSSNGVGLNSPDLSEDLKPRARAIKDISQLSELIKNFEQENRDRNLKNGRIMAKYNAERPYSNSQQKEDGLDWKSNFSTQPLATLIDRVAPRFVTAIQSARYLTSASLPGHVPGAVKKTEEYRKAFTSLCRKRSGWKDFISELSQENALFGYTCAGYTNEYDWFPRHFRQDEFFVPAATKQNSAHCQMLVLREAFLTHELFEMISDEKAAESAGWNIKNTVDSINEAMPESITKNFQSDTRRYEDLVRESNLYASLANGAKVIVAYHAFVTEVTGKVSHYIVNGRGWKELFVREDRFANMAEVATFFSFQQANGNLQASKGVGRTVYALAGIIDRSRNEVTDRLQLSGKIILRGDSKKINAFKMRVVGNAIVISKDFELGQTKIESGVEEFMQLDAWVVRIMDEIAGNISPTTASDNFKGERVTNGQVNYIADLANEAKDVKIERVLTRLADLLTQMQRRAANKQVDDQDAKDFQAQMLAIMSPEEFAYISNQPAAETVSDYTDQERQQIIVTATEVRADPLIDGKAALRAKLTAAVDSEFADNLLLPDEDPTVTAEQTRSQMAEDLLLSAGKQVPVSPRDDDLTHMKVAFTDLEPITATVADDPRNVQIVQIYAQHIQAHIQSATNKGVAKDQLAPYVEQLTKVQQGIQTVIAHAAQVHAQLSDGQQPADAPPLAV